MTLTRPNATTLRVKITPTLLRWARDRVALDIERVAHKIGVNPDVVQAWEDGRASPTLRQAEKLANVLHIPFGYLVLSEPPQTVSPIADFRRLPHARLGQFSPELEAVLNDARRKQAWLSEWRIEEGFSPLDFIGRFSQKASTAVIAEDIRSTLKLSSPTASGSGSWNEHLRKLVDQAEKGGILIIRNGVALSDNKRPLNLEEFRGFSLIDKFAPLIFINAQDSIAGQIFTLAHEIAHLWIGEGGISNPFPQENLSFEVSEIERFCNRVAADLLIPEKLFRERWSSGLYNSTSEILANAEKLAGEFKVSVLAILLRAYDLNILDKKIFQHVYHEARQVSITRADKTAQRNFYSTWKTRNSKVFVRELLIALQQGKVPYRDAAHLLNTKIATLNKTLDRFKTGQI